MSDVRLTATNPADSSVVPVACNDKGELLVDIDSNISGDLTVGGKLLVGASSDSGGALLQVETGHIRVGSVNIRTAKATGIVSAIGNQTALVTGLGTSGELIAVTGAFSGQEVNETTTMPTSGSKVLRDYGDIRLFLSTADSGSLYIKRDAGSGSVDVVLTVQS